MSTASAHAAAFYRAVALGKALWTIRDADGFPAPLLPDGRRAQPFWSERSRAERVIATVPDYAKFEPHEITAAAFVEHWLPGLERDGVLVGINWSGACATGHDATAAEVLANIELHAGSLDGHEVRR